MDIKGEPCVRLFPRIPTLHFCHSGIDRYAGERTAQTEQITRKDVSYGKTLQELADLYRVVLSKEILP